MRYLPPNSRSLQEQNEEKSAGIIKESEQKRLADILYYSKNKQKDIQYLMRKNHLPFLATDRNVLNLPAIGKSMAFETIGITAEGKRILRFDHDYGRNHSPIINKIGKVYILENKSVAAYLRQLDKMGEKVEEYASIWNYTCGETEPRFSLYEYPGYEFKVTDKISNLELV